MNEDDCLFCKMVARQIPVTKIYEDEQVLAFLDIHPVSDGHTLVVPRQHFRRLHDCPPELLGQVASRLGNVARAVVAATEADGYNLLCNNGRAAGQIIEHLHFHIIPRKTADGVFDRWPSHEYPEGRIEAVAEAICENL
ncbi:MAG: HIT family protein [Phycisphaerales bacterium]|nr:MAG: HIT family protein [Phycisphaerales bacterium]